MLKDTMKDKKDLNYIKLTEKDLEELAGKKEKDKQNSSINKCVLEKQQIEQEIDSRAERYSNKRGCDLSYARLKVCKENPDLYAKYRRINEKTQNLSHAEIWNVEEKTR